MNIQFVSKTIQDFRAVKDIIPYPTHDRVLFELMLEEFLNTLPRNVSEVKKPDLLNRLSSTPTYRLQYKGGTLAFKFSNDCLSVRASGVKNNSYEDVSGSIQCLTLLEEIHELEVSPCPTTDQSNPVLQ